MRDITAATGKRGGPASWKRAGQGARVRLQGRGWTDARRSFLYRDDTRYGGDGAQAADGDLVHAAARQARGGELGDIHVQGPVLRAPVWTWEVPLYFFLGGTSAGASWVALACDAAGDERSAATARKLSLGLVMLCPPLLIADLGRPLRFLNMLRIVKFRSPMSMGAWCLSLFSTLGAGAVGADLVRRPRVARALGAGNAVVGIYLAAYTGVLLASTAVPVWARSRSFLGPIFICTATATGAASTRLTLAATRTQSGHPTRVALGHIETGALAVEFLLSQINERCLGEEAAAPLKHGRSGRIFRAAKVAALGGLAVRAARPRSEGLHHLASAAFLAAGLGWRYAWLAAGPASARDDVTVARIARST